MVGVLRRLLRHLLEHPIRLLVTACVLVLSSWAITIYAVSSALESGRQADADICRQMNELRRDIYVAALDLGVRPAIVSRFRPSENCERIP